MAEGGQARCVLWFFQSGWAWYEPCLTWAGTTFVLSSESSDGKKHHDLSSVFRFRKEISPNSTLKAVEVAVACPCVSDGLQPLGDSHITNDIWRMG